MDYPEKYYVSRIKEFHPLLTSFQFGILEDRMFGPAQVVNRVGRFTFK